MDREARVMAWEWDIDESKSPMALLPSEMKLQIVSHLKTQQSLSRLSRSCRAWYEVANEELYKRDCRENNSVAIKWMAAHAVDEQTTNIALRTMDISRRWGGRIDAVVPRLSRSNEALPDGKDQIMYDSSTALHFAVFLGNVRLTTTLLDMGASLTIACSPLIWRSMGSEQLFLRFTYFLTVLDEQRFGPAFPIFLAFLQSDAGMCKLLMEHGAGREAMIIDFDTDPKVLSILHFAAADTTEKYRQWQCLFDGFREYVDEPCPRSAQLTPLHVALKSGCTQGMQIAVESGADKEARDGFSRTPLSIGVLGIPHHWYVDHTHLSIGVLGIPDLRHVYQRLFEMHTMCFRKFVELGANVNPEGDSVLVHAVKSFAPKPAGHHLMSQLISFLLEHHADIHGTVERENTNVVNELIKGIVDYNHSPWAQELLKNLLSELVDRGLNLTILTPGVPSPLYRVLNRRKAKTEWLFDLLCEKGATIHENEVNTAFLRWCEIPRLWRTNQYDAWWQYQGQEDEVFVKWCEHPYNVWWWQHVHQISPGAATIAHAQAYSYRDRQLYDIISRLPLPAPLDDLSIEAVFNSLQPSV